MDIKGRCKFFLLIFVFVFVLEIQWAQSGEKRKDEFLNLQNKSQERHENNIKESLNHLHNSNNTNKNNTHNNNNNNNNNNSNNINIEDNENPKLDITNPKDSDNLKKKIEDTIRENKLLNNSYERGEMKTNREEDSDTLAIKLDIDAYNDKKEHNELPQEFISFVPIKKKDSPSVIKENIVTQEEEIIDKQQIGPIKVGNETELEDIADKPSNDSYSNHPNTSNEYIALNKSKDVKESSKKEPEEKEEEFINRSETRSSFPASSSSLQKDETIINDNSNNNYREKESTDSKKEKKYHMNPKTFESILENKINSDFKYVTDEMNLLSNSKMYNNLFHISIHEGEEDESEEEYENEKNKKKYRDYQNSIENGEEVKHDPSKRNNKYDVNTFVTSQIKDFYEQKENNSSLSESYKNDFNERKRNSKEEELILQRRIHEYASSKVKRTTPNGTINDLTQFSFISTDTNNSINNNNNDFRGRILKVYFTENNNLYVKASVGGQLLKLSLSSRVEGLYVFMKDSDACYINTHEKSGSKNEKKCYDPSVSKTAKWCNNNVICLPAILTNPYECFSEPTLYLTNKVEYPNVYYDALRYNESHIEGSDDVVLDILNESDPMNTGSSSVHRRAKKLEGFFEQASIKLVLEVFFYKKWSLFKDTEGILGLAGKELSCRTKGVWNDLLERNSNMFAVDIVAPLESILKFSGTIQVNENAKGKEEELISSKTNSNSLENSSSKVIPLYQRVQKENNSTESEIHLGDYRREYGEIIWAEPRERGGIFSDSFMQFTIYNMEVCDKNIFGKSSSNWQGVVDLSSKCLVLPKMFWLSLMEYLPIEKNDDRCIPQIKNEELNEESTPRMCRVSEQNRPLPILKFVLEDNDIVNNNNINYKKYNLREISIPLDNLIMNEPGHKGYLCIIPDMYEGRINDYKGRTTKPLIKLGWYVLNNLYVVVDQDNYRVGFAPKKNFYHSNEKCTASKECIGDQIYEPALNMCVNPDCSIWYFYTLNEETKRYIQSYLFYRNAVRGAKISAR